jgi:hypothetical protein
MSLTEGDCVYYTDNGPDDKGVVLFAYESGDVMVQFPDETDIYPGNHLTKVG